MLDEKLRAEMEAVIARMEGLEAIIEEIETRGIEPLKASMERIKALSEGDESLMAMWNEDGISIMESLGKMEASIAQTREWFGEIRELIEGIRAEKYPAEMWEEESEKINRIMDAVEADVSQMAQIFS